MPATEIPTPLPTNTIVLTNTATVTPTHTPLPTKTSIPATATVPAPDKVLEYLSNVQVVSLNTFDQVLSGANWSFTRSGGIHTANGVLEVSGPSWNTIADVRKFTEGQGAVLDFTYTKGTVFEVYVSYGLPDTDDYKAFCVFLERNLAITNVWAAKNSLGGETIPGDLVLRPGKNYSLMMAVIPNGEFITIIWEPADPSKTKYYHEKIGKNWSHLSWDFGIAAKTGTLSVDNYQKIKFDSIK